jgi:hypothetical protein
VKYLIENPKCKFGVSNLNLVNFLKMEDKEPEKIISMRSLIKERSKKLWFHEEKHECALLMLGLGPKFNYKHFA